MIGEMSFSALAETLPARHLGGENFFSELSTDSRSLSSGSAFLALKGERFDGNCSWCGIYGHKKPDCRKLDAYLKNMELSQSRTRSILEFILNNESINQLDKSWLQTKLTANGLSSSKPVFKNSIIDQESSQRVEFRIITNSDEKLSNIAKSFEKNLDLR